MAIWDDITISIDEELIPEDEEYDLIPEKQKKIFYLYELKKIFKEKSNSLVTFSPNSVNLLIIEKEEFVEVKGWIPDADSFEYQPKQNVSNLDNEIDIVQKSERFFYSYIDIQGGVNFNNGQPFVYEKNRLYFISPTKIETDEDILNFGSYIQSLTYEEGLTASRHGKKVFQLTDLESWTTRDGNQAIIRIFQQLNNFSFDKIKIKSPSSFLLDSIKITGYLNEELTSPVIRMSKDLAPLWMNPIEKNGGEINFLNYWMSNNIFSLEKIWSFESKENIFLNKLLPTNEDKEEEGYSQTFTSVESAEINLDSFYPWTSSRSPNGWGESVEVKPANLNKKFKLEFTKNNVLNNVIAIQDTIPSEWNFFNNESPWRNSWKDDEGNIYYTDHRIDKVGTKGIDSVTLVIKEKIYISSLYELLKEVLTASFNYNNNFKGAGYKNETTGELNVMALYKQEFEGKNIVDYISGLEKAWEKKNTSLVNVPEYKIYYQNYKIIKSMLSSYLYGNYAIANGGNDDFKFLLPWYFDLLTEPKWTGSGSEDDGNGKWEYKDDLRVNLNSIYFDFDFENKKISLKNDIISEKQILSANTSSWYWPSISEVIEETQLPSLSAIDFKLSDDNVGKFLVYDIGENKNHYGANNDFFKTTLNKVQIMNNWKRKEWEFALNLDIPKEINLLGLYGAGFWEIEFFEKEESKIKLTNLQLFKANKQDIGKLKIVL